MRTATRSSARCSPWCADTYDEALKMVNDNPYGNGVAIFTRTAARSASSSST